MVGVVALLCFQDKPLPPRSNQRRQLELGDSVLLLNTNNIEERMARIKAIDGVFVVSEGTTARYPTATGAMCTVLGNSFFDPDGHFVEFNQVTW